MSRTCWIDLFAEQQLEKRFRDVEPEPYSLPFPRKVLEVDSIYDTSLSKRSGFR